MTNGGNNFALHTESGLNVDSIFAPLLDSAARFAAAARSCREGMQTPGPAALEAARTFGDFLRVETLDFLRFPWSAVPAFGGGAGVTAPPAMQDLPALGLTREHQLRWQRNAEIGRRVGDAQQRLQLLWFDALRDAAMAFAARLQSPHLGAATGDVPGAEALHGLYHAWIECAEEAYARVAHSDTFSSALADFMNASSAWRKESQAMVEHWAKTLDLPTRSELNTLMRRVSSLEEQLRLKEPLDPPRTDPERIRRPSRARRGKRP
jgi:hypothetical protein